MSDKITIKGVEAHGYHGFYDFERETGQPFIVDAELKLDLSSAATHDDLDQSVDYNDLAILIHNEIKGEPARLAETVADRIARKILAAYERVDEVTVTLHKPRAPITVPYGDVAIVIKRSR